VSSLYRSWVPSLGDVVDDALIAAAAGAADSSPLASA
jgi:hypothetical protein